LTSVVDGPFLEPTYRNLVTDTASAID